MKRTNSRLRYRPYRRSVSLHRTSPEIVDCDDDLDDTILVLFDGARQPAAAAAGTGTDAATGTGTATAATTSAAAATAAAGSTVQTGAEPATGGAAEPAAGPQPSDSLVDVSDTTLPAETPNVSAAPDLSTILAEKTLTNASPGREAAAKSAGAAAGAPRHDVSGGGEGMLTVDECFSSFAASPAVVRAAGVGGVRRPRAARAGLVTSTPAVPPARSGGKSPRAGRAKRGLANRSPRAGPAGRAGPATSTPAARRRHDSDVVEVTPYVITLEDDDPSVLEVTEVRRVIRRSTPAQSASRGGSARGRRRNPRRNAATPAASAAFEDLTPAVEKSAPVTKADLSANFLPLERADLSSSLEEGELSRSRHHPRLSRSAGRPAGGAAVRPLRRTSSTQRRLQTVVRVARRTLAPRLSADAKKRRRSGRQSGRATPARIRGRPLKQPHREHWMVDRRGCRFAAPLGSSDHPIQFTPEFSESFAQMLSERPKRPIIIDGPNVAYAHGRDQTCSIRGIQIVLEYFKRLGHRCTVFLPSGFVKRSNNGQNRKLLEEMYRAGDLSYTPSRMVGKKVVTSYDDRYVVMYATRVGGVIVSRDLYRDVATERPDWRQTIEQRLLIPVFVGDQLLLPPDPLGREGPGLHEFLTFPPGTSQLPSDGHPSEDGRADGRAESPSAEQRRRPPSVIDVL